MACLEGHCAGAIGPKIAGSTERCKCLGTKPRSVNASHRRLPWSQLENTFPGQQADSQCPTSHPIETTSWFETAVDTGAPEGVVVAG